MKPVFNEIDAKYANRILKVYNLMKDQEPEAFRVHTKGLGVICTNNKGI